MQKNNAALILMARKTRVVFTLDNKKSIADFKKIKKQYLPWMTRKKIDSFKKTKNSIP